MTCPPSAEFYQKDTPKNVNLKLTFSSLKKQDYLTNSALESPLYMTIVPTNKQVCLKNSKLTAIPLVDCWPHNIWLTNCNLQMPLTQRDTPYLELRLRLTNCIFGMHLIQ